MGLGLGFANPHPHPRLDPGQVRHGFPLGVNLKTKPMAFAAGMSPADYEWYLEPQPEP